MHAAVFHCHGDGGKSPEIHADIFNRYIIATITINIRVVEVITHPTTPVIVIPFYEFVYSSLWRLIDHTIWKTQTCTDWIYHNVLLPIHNLHVCCIYGYFWHKITSMFFSSLWIERVFYKQIKTLDRYVLLCNNNEAVNNDTHKMWIAPLNYSPWRTRCCRVGIVVVFSCLLQ